MIRFLPEQVVLAIHEDQVRRYGGALTLRDAGALDSALHMPMAQFGGQYVHSSFFHIAAAYGFHLSQNHPFIDGNKRVAGMTMLTFLAFNGLEVIADEGNYYETIMALARGELDKERLVEWLRSNTRGTPPALT
jgi:death-on-curing protein